MSLSKPGIIQVIGIFYGNDCQTKDKKAEVYTVKVRLKNLPEITATFKELKEAKRFIFEKEIWLTKDPLNYFKLGRKYLLKDLNKKFTAETKMFEVLYFAHAYSYK